jgi:glutamate racemase
MKIGFFDSGLGGLTVLKATIAHLPQYDYVFYGDTRNVPYGEKTEEEIYELTKAGMEYLFSQGCVLVVIACNTASAQTLRKLQDTYLPEHYPDRKILGVIIPMVETVIDHKSTSALLIATTRTVSSGKYDFEFNKHAQRPTLVSVATPTLVPYIEAGNITQAVEDACDTIRACKGTIDTVILGCTHYGLLREGITAAQDTSLNIFSADQIIPHKLENYLERHTEISSRLSTGSSRSIHLSKHTQAYDNMLADMLGGYLITQ